MRITILLFFCFSNFFIFSQEKSIEKFIYKSEYKHLEHLGSPKSIFVKEYEFDNKGERKSYLSKNYNVIYDSRDQIIKHLVYGKNSQNPFKITTYDNLNRISKIEVNRENGNGEIIFQYFSKDLEFSDSLKIFSKKIIEQRKIINYFKNNLITRRDLIEKGTLRYFTKFEYNSKNQLIKVLNINTKNGFGRINKLGNTTTKRLNRNDSTLYNYKNIGDTLIVNSERFKGLVVTKKTFEDDNVAINIEEQTSTKSGLTFQKSTNFKWKDSTKIESKYYKKNNILKSYYNTYIYQDKIVSKWVDPIMMKEGKPEKIEVTIIQTVFDDKGNWISKIFIRNKLKVKEVKRTIKY
jgi:hypothetical protein